MLEWLLTENNLTYATLIGIIGSIFLFGTIAFSLPMKYYTTEFDKKGKYFIGTFLIAMFTLPIIIGIVYGILSTKIVKEYTSNSEWKTIYTNDIKTDVVLKIRPDKESIVLATSPASPIGEKYKSYITNMDGTIIAQKGGLEEKKKVHLSKENIIHDTELTPTSKITKVEYRPANKMYKKAFSNKGNLQSSDVDGLIRITIEEDDSSDRAELRKLFQDQ